MRWLIAEDDKALGSFLARALPAAGDSVDVAGDGREALLLFTTEEPDLLILDLDLPSLSGLEVLHAVRELSPLCPVLVVSGRADDETRITCLNNGADDCLQKPFSLAELRARCAAVLRRQQLFRDRFAGDILAIAGKHEETVLRCGLLEVERLSRRVEVAGEPVHLTNREFSMLEQLLHAGGAPVSRTELRDRLWGSAVVETSVVDVHLGALRRKLAAHSEAPLIDTVRGAGFCLRAPSPAMHNQRHEIGLSGALHA